MAERRAAGCCLLEQVQLRRSRELAAALNTAVLPKKEPLPVGNKQGRLRGNPAHTADKSQVEGNPCCS